VETALKHDNSCPVCKKTQGVIRGNQPPGQMQFHRRPERLPGFNDNISLRSLTIKGLTNNHYVFLKDINKDKRTASPYITHKNDLKENQKAHAL